jgi:hypothetical protein
MDPFTDPDTGLTAETLARRAWHQAAELARVMHMASTRDPGNLELKLLARSSAQCEGRLRKIWEGVS